MSGGVAVGCAHELEMFPEDVSVPPVVRCSLTQFPVRFPAIVAAPVTFSVRSAVTFTVTPAGMFTVEYVCVPESVVVPVGANMGAATVTLVLPVIPSTVAETVVAPEVSAVTSPVAVTVATAGVDEAHVTLCPVIAFPLLSVGAAVSCRVAPSSTVSFGGVTATAATTGVTVIPSLPETPSTVAEIVDVPAATPVTKPLEETDAMVGEDDVHEAACPLTVFPLLSTATAVSCTVEPIATVLLADDTDTELTVGAAGPVEPPPLQVETTAANIAASTVRAIVLKCIASSRGKEPCHRALTRDAPQGVRGERGSESYCLLSVPVYVFAH
jgi:hypothetical protein